MQWALLIAQVLFWVIKTFFFKDIAHEVIEAADLIKKVPDLQAREAYAVELKQTVKRYKTDKDKRPLLRLVKRLRDGGPEVPGPKAA